MAAVLGGAEEHFAKKLANNDKKIRDRALKRLQAWLSSRPSTAPAFGEIELLKIWKGLFYCFWMSDKPLIQEELAVNISKLLHNFKNIDSGFSFIITFFKTFHKEWHGIDRLRLDKFYMLIRFFIKENFELLNKNNWKSSLCTRLSTIYKEGPLSPTSESVPIGIRLHLCSIFLSELEGVKCKQIPPEAVTVLLDPFFILAAETKSQVVSRAVKEGVFEKILEIESRQENGNDSENEENEAKTPLEVNLQEIAERLFILASSRDILGRNRNMLYLYIKKFKKSLPETTKSVDDTTGKRKVEDQEENEEEVVDKKKRKKQKKTKTSEADEVIHGNGIGKKQSITEEENEVNSNKKKKQRKKTETVETEYQNDEENINGVPHLNGMGEKANINTEEHKEEEADKTPKRKSRKKAKTVQDDQNQKDENGNEMGHLNGIGKKDIKRKKETPIDENPSKEVPDKKKYSLRSASSQNVKLNGSEQSEDKDTYKGNEQTNQSQVPKQASKNGVSEDELDKALKKMRQKISESNSIAKTPLPVKKKKDKNEKKMTPQAFATFMKTKTPPAYVKKPMPQTEPKKTKEIKLSTPKSAPHPSRKKKVTIELSKNKAQTTLEYVKSLKTSPSVPFDASRSPAFGLLKTESLNNPTPKTKKFTPKRRSKAVDFF